MQQQNHDSLVSYLVSYKINNYSNKWNKDGYLENNKGIKNNYDFVEFVVNNGYFPDRKKNMKLFHGRVKYLSLLVEIDSLILLGYILKYISNSSDKL